MSDAMFKDIDSQMRENFVENYRGEKDIAEVLDMSRFKDDLEGLIGEMTKQSATYAYWANLRRIADDKYEKLVQNFEILKSRKTKTVVETLNSEGVKTPTGKAIESKFHQLYKDADFYKKYVVAIEKWRKRKAQLAIIEKAVSNRETTFKSLSYLMGNMMNHGYLHMKRKKH